jgi:hypothetical protein
MKMYEFRKMRARVFLEPFDIGLMVFTRPYPEIDGAEGSYVNMGNHFSAGIDYQINSGLKGFTMLQLFHASNTKEYSKNPALEGIDIVTGLQF